MYLVNILVSIHNNQLVLRTIIVEQANGLIEKDVQAFLYRFSFVVGALVQLTSIQVTHARHLGWVSVYIVNVLVGPANITPRESLQQFLSWNVQIDRHIYLPSNIL